MKIGIIGTGNLSEAIVKSFLKSRALTGPNISVFDVSSERLNYWAGTYDVIPCTDMDSVVQNSDILFLAVRSNSFQKLMPNLNFLLRTFKPLVVSLARGITLEEIEDLMDFITPMARIITNFNVGVGAGITAYCFNELVTDEQKGTLIELFASTGTLVEIEEQEFEAFAAVSAASSIFVCSLMETLRTCSVGYGLPTDVAAKAVLHNILGTAKLLAETGQNQDALISKLCPPNSMGTAGLMTLKEEGFDRAVIKGFVSAIEKKA